MGASPRQGEMRQQSRPCCVQMPNMAGLGLNASHALPLAAAAIPLQSGGFMSGGSYHSAHSMQLQAPAQVPMPQAYAAQVRARSIVRSGLLRRHAFLLHAFTCAGASCNMSAESASGKS